MEQKQVLVVDDNEMNREVLTRRLERQGFTIATAEDGQKALEKMRAQSFQLVLLDIMMPRMNGYQVLETMKADAALKHLPVIIISAVDELDSIVKCIELGAEDYLFKPFNPVLLKARVNAVMRRGTPVKAESVISALENIKADVSALASGADGTLAEAQTSRLNNIQSNIEQVLATLK